MDIKKIKELVKVLEESTLTEIEVESESGRVVLKREVKVAPQEAVSHVVSVAPRTVEQATPAQTVSAFAGTTVNSPLVGTYYASASPDKPAFVNVGDRVKKGQVVAIIEAMKVMNEIVSPADGIVKEIKVTNASLVQFDQVLMIIE